MIKIAPSMVSAPFADLRSVIKELENAGADLLHFDLEDGNFVPVMTLGVKIISEVRALTQLPFDVHLMVQNPEWLIPELAQMNVDMLSVHYEACPYPRRTLKMISQYKMKAGLAFNPKTPLPSLRYFLPYLSFVDILTTEPEQGDSSYLPPVLNKVSEGRKQTGLEHIQWEVDGAISTDNAAEVVAVGTDIIVAGRSIFKTGRIAQNLLALRSACYLDKKVN
jgi:ribulose-phosphate 3-epimerase